MYTDLAELKNKREYNASKYLRPFWGASSSGDLMVECHIAGSPYQGAAAAFACKQQGRNTEISSASDPSAGAGKGRSKPSGPGFRLIRLLR